MSIVRQRVQLDGIILELEGEPDALEMQIAGIVADPHGLFTDKVIQAAMAHDALLVYMDEGLYTKPLSIAVTAWKLYGYDAMPKEVQSEVIAAINTIATGITVSCFPAVAFTADSTLKFYIGPDANPRSITNFWAAIVSSVPSPEASLAA